MAQPDAGTQPATTPFFLPSGSGARQKLSMQAAALAMVVRWGSMDGPVKRKAVGLARMFRRLEALGSATCPALVSLLTGLKPSF